MGIGVYAGAAQEVREPVRIGQGMASGLRRQGTGQVVVEMGKHRAWNMRCGKLLSTPVRTRQIVAAIHH